MPKKKPHRSRAPSRGRVRKNPSDLAEQLLAEQARQASVLRRTRSGADAAEAVRRLFKLEEIEDFLDYCQEAERSAATCVRETLGGAVTLGALHEDASKGTVSAVWDKVLEERSLWSVTVDSEHTVDSLGLFPTDDDAVEAGEEWLAENAANDPDERNVYEVEEVLGGYVARLRYAQGTARIGILLDYAEEEGVVESRNEPAHLDAFSSEEMAEYPEFAQLRDEFVGAGWEPSPNYSGLIRMTYTRRAAPWETR